MHSQREGTPITAKELVCFALAILALICGVITIVMMFIKDTSDQKQWDTPIIAFSLTAAIGFGVLTRPLQRPVFFKAYIVWYTLTCFLIIKTYFS